MGLVDYSDSEDEARDETPAKKRKMLGDKKDDATALPPLPASFRNLYSSAVRTSTQDDPSLHAGRKRVIPHVAGNWPTHVYLECKNDMVHCQFKGMCSSSTDLQEGFQRQMHTRCFAWR